MKKKRNAKMQWCEVVRIDSPLILVNSRQHACHYETATGAPLAPGYYLVLWPAGACLSLYGRELRYLGPFVTAATASLLKTSALGLEVVALEADSIPTSVPAPVKLSQPPHLHWSHLRPNEPAVRLGA